MSLILFVKRRKGQNISENHEQIQIGLDESVLELKKQIQAKYRIDPLRQWLTHEDLKTVLNDNEKPIRLCNLENNQTLIVKDLGPQLLWHSVFYLEYLGPIAVLSLIYFFGNYKKYSQFQNVAYLMAVGHYLKRILETKFVHVFSRESMPKKRAFINFLHYWVLFGFNVGMELFIVRDFTSKPLTAGKMVLVLFWMLFQFLNLMCHITLSNLRKAPATQKGEFVLVKKQRGIPHGFGFDQVSCANYFWELCSWVSFTLYSECLMALVFTVFSFSQMLIWAQEKHSRYKKEFGDKYPRNRKAMVPFVI